MNGVVILNLQKPKGSYWGTHLPNAFLSDAQIKQAVESCRTRKEFISSMRDYAACGIMLPLTVLQYMYSGNSE